MRKRRDPPGGKASPAMHHDDGLVRIAGLPSVAELFRAAPERVERLFFDAQRKQDVAGFCKLLARRRKPYRLAEADELRRLAGTAMHGGVVALAAPRPILDLDLAAAHRWAEQGQPLLLLDGVGNPHNIGAIARTAAFFGVERLVLSDHPGQAGLSDASYRIAKGGLERVAVYRATRFAQALERLQRDYHVVGTATGHGLDLAAVPATGKPVALVLGNEEEGLSKPTLAACQTIVSLQGAGRVQSLNVAATAAILIHALLARPHC